MAKYLQHDDYTVGWICAIPVEFQAAILMLDDRHNGVFPQLPGGDAAYAAGSIGDHFIVIACLPEQKTGNVAAAGLMRQMSMSFQNMDYAFMVGIGAGVPGPNGLDPDVRLGDVVVAFPTDDKSSGIVGYELGKETVDGFLKRQDNSCRMAPVLENTIALIKNQSEIDGTYEFLEHLHISTLGKRKYGEKTASHAKSKFTHPIRSGQKDRLYSNDTDMVIIRPPRPNAEEPMVHYGPIASGDKVVKNAKQREELRRKYGVLCIEMEAAGLRDSYPAAIIRGISDYADSHKNDQWQPYAAFVAAAYAKGVIRRIPPALKHRHLEDLEAIHASQSYKTGQTHTGNSEKRAKISEDDWKKCLESLSFEQIDARLATIKKAHAKTCEWLYQQREYNDWLNKDLLEEHHGFLWMKGKPGAGKSTIMKHALHSRTMLSQAITISFFFNARGCILERSVLGMYRSLLHQLLLAIPSLQDDLAPIYFKKGHQTAGIDWTITELQEFIEKIISGLQEQQHLVFFIDALDECKLAEVRDMVEFFQSLGETAVSQQKSLNVCFASRHYPRISIPNCIELVVEDQEGHKNDIERYVESQFRSQRGKAMDRIRAEILRKASGVFLWVVLVVNILKEECDNGMTHKMSKKLDEIPPELDDLFADILSRGNATGLETTLCLQWLLFSKRPLKREELYFAILFGSEPEPTKEWDPEDKDFNDETVKKFILSCSKGLAEVSKGKDQTVQFIHETVRDFFLLRNGLAKVEPSLQANVVGLSEDQLKRCCYECIMTDQFNYIFETPLPKAKSDTMKDLQNRVRSQLPFLEYAVQNIFKHADVAEQNDAPQETFLATFQTPENPYFRNWKTLRNLFEKHNTRWYTPEINLLYVLLDYNLPSLSEILLRSLPTTDLDAIGGYFGSAIYLASLHGNLGIIQLLINAGADVNISGERNLPPLEGALSNGHTAIVDILLQNGAHKGLYKDGMTPLHFAAKYGSVIAIEKILSYPGVELDVKDNKGRTPLAFAIIEGHELVTRLLLEKGADPNAYWQKGDFYHAGFKGSCNLLQAASDEGHGAIVSLLLEYGANVNVQGGKFGNALQIASAKGHDAIVSLLLEKGADVNAQGGYYGNALQAASRGGYENVVNILLEKGADMNAQGGFVGNVLQAACVSGSVKVVQLLLEKGLDINAQGGIYVNALQEACRNGSDKMVQLLLGKGANVNAPGGFYGTALMAACSQGSEDIVRLLIDNGADVNMQVEGGLKGRNALEAAYRRNHSAIVQILREAGAKDIPDRPSSS